MKTQHTHDPDCGTRTNSFLDDPVKLFLFACAVLVLWSTSALADVNRRVSEGYTMINMNTPAAWSYLKNIQHNPITAALLGGLAPCDGNMSIVHSDRGDHQLLIFTFTSSVTGNGVTYVIADVNTFLTTLKKTAASPKTAKPGVLCHEGVDMSDGSRSNYVLKLLDSGGFVMELERSDIGILFVLGERDINGLLELAEGI